MAVNPIRVLTRTKSCTSADHLPIGYLLNDFQLHRSNFLAPPPPAAAADATRRKGVDTIKKNCAHRTLDSNSQSLSNLLNDFD